MPELPDLTVYIDELQSRLEGDTLQAIRLASPFVLRTVSPTVDELVGRQVVGFARLGKQIVCALEGETYFVIHLMIAGRLQWHDKAKPLPKRNALVAFDFSRGSVVLTEVSKKKRAALRLVSGQAALDALDPGGLEVAGLTSEAFSQRLRQENHTLKRALTDQRVFAGIGNAYSDEILLRAGLSPFKRPKDMTDAELAALHEATLAVLEEWTERLREKASGGWPKKVTAFHPEMAVHGKYREPCPVCASPVQRIVFAENEANYCARCQTGGRMLADRSLSRLLKDNWPKKLEDLESM